MQTIDITTTQNVTIEYELASLRDRILAFFIDALIIIFGYFILLFTLMSTLGTLLEGGLIGSAVFSLLPIVIFIGYQFLSEVLANGQSWGKKTMKIKVARLDGLEASTSDYLLRAVFQIVDTLFSGGVLAILFISSSDKNQRLGDLTANTTVIKLNSDRRFSLPDILKIDSLSKYEPQYPAVTRLTEQDMLVIKSAIKRHQQYKNQAHAVIISEVTKQVSEQLQIAEVPKNKVEFLKTLIRDYIVLTR
ncbi:MAG: RDD family protein [Saprospiraceae bacterium]